MGIAERVLTEVKGISRSQRVRKVGDYVAATALLDVEHFEEAIHRMNAALASIVERGEKISCDLGSGEVVDSGVKGFDILKGVLLEVYDYRKTSAAFIRLYHLRDKRREWLALYVDENPHTPWWSEEERRE